MFRVIDSDISMKDLGIDYDLYGKIGAYDPYLFSIMGKENFLRTKFLLEGKNCNICDLGWFSSVLARTLNSISTVFSFVYVLSVCSETLILGYLAHLKVKPQFV